jgi:hypothetical protein
MAGRPVGYLQAAITIVSFALTMLFGVKFILWYLGNWSTLNSPETDPLESMMRVGREGRWAALGAALFTADWLWTLTTNASILRPAPKNEDAGKPPKLNQELPPRPLPSRRVA